MEKLGNNSTTITKEGDMPRVKVHNEPKQSEHAVDDAFNRMRIEMVPHIVEFVRSHESFHDEAAIGITFAHEGKSSIITIIETATGGKTVLKIPRAEAFSAGEAQFLRVWEEAGVTVPHVVEVGKIQGHSYLLMEYIDAQILNDTYTTEGMIEQRKYVEMAQELRKMHTPKATGFGFVINREPEFGTAAEWLHGEDMRKRFTSVEEHSFLGELTKKLPAVFRIIEEHVEREGSHYCHDDFGGHNIFATEPLTIFDTNAKFNNGYYDLSRNMMSSIAANRSPEVNQQMIEGYFGDDVYNEQALYAYTFINCCMKFPYWIKTDRSKQLERVRDYLLENKNYV